MVFLLAGHGLDPLDLKLASQVNDVFLEFKPLLDLELLQFSSGLAWLGFRYFVNGCENLTDLCDVRCWAFREYVAVFGCRFFLLRKRGSVRDIGDQLQNFGSYLMLEQV